MCCWPVLSYLSDQHILPYRSHVCKGMLSIMLRHCVLECAICRSFTAPRPPPTALTRVSTDFSLGLPLLLLPSTLPVTHTFSNFPFLIKCPRNLFFSDASRHLSSSPCSSQYTQVIRMHKTNLFKLFAQDFISFRN